MPEGAFYVYADVSAFTDDSAAWCTRLLDEADVAVTPGNDFGHHLADRHVRFSYATGIDRIELGPRSPGPVRDALTMATTPRDDIAFDEDELSDIAARMAGVAAGGWVNLVPDLPEDLEVPARGALSPIFGARGPVVPMATWTPPGSENPPRMTFGVEHGSGPARSPGWRRWVSACIRAGARSRTTPSGGWSSSPGRTSPTRRCSGGSSPPATPSPRSSLPGRWTARVYGAVTASTASVRPRSAPRPRRATSTKRSMAGWSIGVPPTTER